ncbi:autotransporter outer membrane beta-barrel domain-containing protein [Pseudomonas putida]|uniref:autotransporter outer membrane beta-barrel domain-containing protein n=1 Tax=Pseudomonas putida TaxID=303 RepID=UPI00301C2235
MRHFQRKALPACVFASVVLNSLSVAHATPPDPRPTVVNDYDNYTYTITSQYVNYDADAALLEAQPWWGNATLANALSGIVGYNAGYHAPSISSLGVLFAYGVSSGYVQIAYYMGTAIDCPSGCPNTMSDFYYAVGTRQLIQPVTPPPVTPPGVTPPQVTPPPVIPPEVIPPEVIEQALITFSSISGSLASTASGINSVTSNVNMLINGAHSRPLSHWVAPGKNTFWVGGDWGRDDHGQRDGSNGLAEVGFGRNFGFAQFNATLGQTWARQNLSDSGRVEADGQYLTLEAIVPVSESRKIYATLGGFGHWGESDISRGYINMGKTDASKGSPDTDTWGVRARLDWVDALTLGNTGISPYVDLSYTKSHLDGYTEKGGAFPARFDSQTDDYTEARLGFNAQTPLPFAGFNFISNLEAVHRFEDRTSGVNGEVTGVFDFSLPGEDVRNDWVKAGAGVEGLVGPGKASFMLNGTSKSEMPNLWLAASYQLEF